MDDLNRMLAETLHDAADDAPSGSGLLGGVHERSRRYRRRRLVTVTAVSAAAAVVVAGIPVVTMLVTRPQPVMPPVASPPAATAAPSAPARSSAPAASNRPSVAPPSSAHSSSTANAVTLSAGWTAPVFPYTLPATDGMSAPVASIDDGNLIAFFEATENRHHADVTITVSGHEPVFTTEASETPITVRGHAATLRTVDVAPAKQLTVYWKESPSRWIRLATDDTYTPAQVVALADAMTGGAVAVLPPFDLGLSPDGLRSDTVTASRMIFTRPGGGEFATVLRKRQQLTGVNQKVGGHDAVLTRRNDQVTLAVDVPGWNATLQITVGGGLTVSDADLLRYAAGVRILNRSDPE
ncbi:hypothetical protein [Actinoplanes sp. NPDC020271]|uniref:hypothetical protein n=1 Tax=Actinoplanes sp. NPDC020271 TaxID=3363896 RepID=UPI00379F73C6